MIEVRQAEFEEPAQIYTFEHFKSMSDDIEALKYKYEAV
jgi:hypothetical protein